MKNMKIKIASLFILGLIATSELCQAQIADSATYLSDVKNELNKVWPKNRTINLVFHGHSVPSGYRTDHKVNTLESYPHLVLEKLKAIYPYAVINVITTSVGGENSITGETRFDHDVLPHQPDVLFIDYALNDRTAGLEKAKEAWEKMIQKALKANIKVILLTPSGDTRVDMHATDRKSLQAHALQITALAKKYHIGLVDSYAAFMKVLKQEGSIKPYMAGVNHPNLKGHQLISDEIMKWFVPGK